MQREAVWVSLSLPLSQLLCPFSHPCCSGRDSALSDKDNGVGACRSAMGATKRRARSSPPNYRGASWEIHIGQDM